MSIALMTLVWHLDIATTNQKMVLLKCADHASDDGSGIYPGRPFIAASTGLSIKTVGRVLKLFEDNGVLIKTSNGGGRHRAAVYVMNIDRLLALYPWVKIDGEEKIPPFMLKNGAIVSGSKLGHPDPVSKLKTGSHRTNTGSPSTETGSELDPLTLNNHQKPSLAREAIDDGDAASPLDGGGDAVPDIDAPKNRRWRSCEKSLRSEIGDKEFNSWIKPAVVEFDDGQSIILSLPTQFMRDYVDEQFRTVLANHFDGDVEIIELQNFERASWLKNKNREVAEKPKGLVKVSIAPSTPAYQPPTAAPARTIAEKPEAIPKSNNQTVPTPELSALSTNSPPTMDETHA